MISTSDHNDRDPLRGLTSKQCQVLDLLIQHKTSKEISRTLGISPHTVDQRIMLARAKLQVTTRSEVAQAYRRLLAEQGDIPQGEIYDRSIYGSSDLAEPGEARQDGRQEATDGYEWETRTAGPERDGPEWNGSPPQALATLLPNDTTRSYYHVLPEAFDGRGGTLWRLGAIVMITVFLTLIILGGMAIYSELAHMFDS